MLKLKELDKLHKWLVDNAKMYGWTIKREDAGNHIFNTHQIIVYRKDVRLWDVICQRGSYGYTEGLLEIMGDIVDMEKAGDSVEGWLTADNVIERILRKYGVAFVEETQKYELVVKWYKGNVTNVYEYSSFEKARSAAIKMKKDFGMQINWMGIREKV